MSPFYVFTLTTEIKLHSAQLKPVIEIHLKNLSFNFNGQNVFYMVIEPKLFSFTV